MDEYRSPEMLEKLSQEAQPQKQDYTPRPKSQVVLAWALAILSILSPDQFRLAVLTQDDKTLTMAQGVGKKMAQRILLELKEKLGAAELPDTSSGGGGVTVTHGSAVAEATAALGSLGYSQAEIGAALKTVEGAETLTAEQLVRQALRAMVTK